MQSPGEGKKEIRKKDSVKIWLWTSLYDASDAADLQFFKAQK